MTEWLPQITATTPHDEIMTQPSALNPYPERITHGTFEVAMAPGRRPSYRSNFHVYVRYGNEDAVRGQMPTRWPVTPDMMQPPTLADTKDSRWTPLTDETNFVPVDEALQREDPFLASRYLQQRHHDDVQRVYGRVVEWNAEFPYTQYFGNFINVCQEQIAAERPGVALALANAVFANAIAINGERVPLEWGLDGRRGVLANLVAPGIEPAYRRISNEEYDADPSHYHDLQGLIANMGSDTAHIFESQLARTAVTAAIQLGLEPPIVIQKLRALQTDEAEVVHRSTEALLAKVAAIPEDARTPADIDRLTSPTEVPTWLIRAAAEH